MFFEAQAHLENDVALGHLFAEAFLVENFMDIGVVGYKYYWLSSKIKTKDRACLVSGSELRSCHVCLNIPY
jgi:hypothetical protein